MKKVYDASGREIKRENYHGDKYDRFGCLVKDNSKGSAWVNPEFFRNDIQFDDFFGIKRK